MPNRKQLLYVSAVLPTLPDPLQFLRQGSI